MKKLVVIVMFCCACGGKLSNEQRQKLHEGMATQDIKRVSESDLQEAGLNYAKSVLADVEKTDRTLRQKSRIDSIASRRQVRIFTLIPDDATLHEIEQKLVEAYIAGNEGAAQGTENLQRAGEDSLLYTKPVFKERPDGSQQFSYAVGIMMSKKAIVLSMPKP